MIFPIMLLAALLSKGAAFFMRHHYYAGLAVGIQQFGHISSITWIYLSIC